MSLFVELKRRNVFRVATAYLVVGWLLTEIATTMLPTFGAPEWVAKATIFIFALAFIPVLIFAWAFEMTPEGIKREKDVLRDESITSETGTKLSYVTIAAVVVGIAFLAWDKTGNQAVQPADEVVVTAGAPSVAVLPFVNMSGNADNEYFSDGLTETLLHMLAQIPELRVAARTSSFAFKGDEIDIREIADALDVAHVLEGSVQRSGNRVRITAQLIRADDGFHVWSENFDRTLDDIFAIQDEIAERVGDALSESLLGVSPSQHIAGVGTENLEAYDLYLRALAEHSKGSYGALKAAEGFLKDALSLDPGFLDAKTELANSYLLQWRTGLIEGGVAPADVVTLVEQVLAERPDDVRATTVLYLTEFFSNMFGGNFAAAMDASRLLEEHANAHPNDFDATMSIAGIMMRFNREEEALALLERLARLDPLNPDVYTLLSMTYVNMERWDDAIDAASRSIELEPVNPTAQTMLARAYRESGDGVEWLRNYIKAMEVDPEDQELPGHIGVFLYDLHLPEEADQFRARVLSMAPSSPPAYLLNMLHSAETGDIEGARAAARKTIEDDVDDRLDAYSLAVQYLVDDAIRNDTVEETLEYLESNVPGLVDFESAVDVKYLVVRFQVMSLWTFTMPFEEIQRRYDLLFSSIRSIGIDPEDRPLSKAMIRILQGDSDAAAEVLATEYFEDPIETNLDWRSDLADPLFKDILDDPRIAANIERYQGEMDRLREEIREYLSSSGK